MIIKYIGPFTNDGEVKDRTVVLCRCDWCDSEWECQYRTLKRYKNDLPLGSVCRACSKFGRPLWPEDFLKRHCGIISIDGLNKRGGVYGATVLGYKCLDCGELWNKQYRFFDSDTFWLCGPCANRTSKGTGLLFPEDIEGIVWYDHGTLGARNQLWEKTAIAFLCESCGERVETRWAYYRDGGIDGLRVCSKCGTHIAQAKPSYREKRSRIAKELWQDPEFRERVIAAQREGIGTDEYREERSRIAKELWQDPEYRAKMLEILAEVRPFRGKLSKPHKQMKARLNKIGLANFESEEWVGEYRVDELDRGKMKIIEFYGDFYHANPDVYAPDDTIVDEQTARERWDYDEQREEFLIEAGYDLFVVWESDWKESPDEIIKQIENWYY